MTDEIPAVDPVDARVEIINAAMTKIVSGIQGALTHGREPTAQECIDALHGVATLAATALVAIVELSHSVGKLVDITERDFNGAVKAEASAMADVKQAETVKRSFIGQHQNNS